ncbi:sigma-70 RNA polymerase sigma factor region 4 domain-containing protein [Alkalitalea saponilacus]|nr:sigma-70 family RNA polymerase sigma factor [Alkalitalea saponilacus]
MKICLLVMRILNDALFSEKKIRKGIHKLQEYKCLIFYSTLVTFFSFSDLSGSNFESNETVISFAHFQKEELEALQFAIENCPLAAEENQPQCIQTILEVAEVQRKQQIHQIFITIIFAVLLLVFIIFLFRLKLKQKNSSLEKEILMRQVAESWTIQISKEKAQKEHLLALYHQLTLRHVATQERLEQLSYRFIKDNSDMHQAIQMELQTMKNEFNAILNEIIHEDLFYSYFDIPKDISLTTGEKIILFLFYCEMSSKQVATLIGITQGNLRVRKSNLRKKLSEYSNQYPEIEKVLMLL